MKRTLPILALVAVAAACEPDARNDANLFLDRVQRIDLDDTVEERERMVDALAHLPLSAEPVQEARDACVEAHRTILEAEALHANARAALEGHAQEDEIAITERQRIERDIQASNRAVERSRGLFSRCHRLTRELELRYRRRGSR